MRKLPKPKRSILVDDATVYCQIPECPKPAYYEVTLLGRRFTTVCRAHWDLVRQNPEGVDLKPPPQSIVTKGIAGAEKFGSG